MPGHMLIYKIFRAEEWDDLKSKGTTKGAPIDLADGYIHFSTADQAGETAARYFANIDGLVLVACDANAFGEALKWEVSRGGALFPHLFRELTLDDVVFAVPLPVFGGTHLFPEPISGYVDPSRQQFDRFKDLPRERAIHMVNLVRLREMAAYPAGHDCADQALKGADAYARYGAETAPLLAELGVRILWRGACDATLIGPAHESWDHMFIVEYPSAHAFLALVTDARYKEAVIHRQAAVRTARLIRTSPLESGTGFA